MEDRHRSCSDETVYREFRPGQRLRPPTNDCPDFVAQEAADDPEDVERQQHGPAGFLATSRSLRDAFSNLRFDRSTASHPRAITDKQVHIFTIADGQITRHRAVRDDLALLRQLGWRPRKPA